MSYISKKIREKTPKSIGLTASSPFSDCHNCIHHFQTHKKHRTLSSFLLFHHVESPFVTTSEIPINSWHLDLQRFLTNKNGMGPLCSTSAGTGRHLARPPQELHGTTGAISGAPRVESIWLGDLPSQQNRCYRWWCPLISKLVYNFNHSGLFRGHQLG